MKKFVLMLVAVSLALALAQASVYASEVDKLIIKKLVDKGIFTQEDANELFSAVKAEAEQELAAKEEMVKQETAKVEEKEAKDKEAVPQWVKNIKLSGDMRLRYQYDDRKGSVSRHRGRMRLRLGAEIKVVDKLKIYTGLFVGNADPRSTDWTFSDSFDHPDIRLDYAYVEYIPTPWATLLGGKLRGMPIYTATDWMFDTDINPEGAAAQLKYSAMDNLDLFFNAGAFVLDEYSTAVNDPLMFVAQPGFELKATEKVSLTTGVAYYGFKNVKGHTLDYSSGSNTLNVAPATGLMYAYDCLNVTSELGVDRPFGDDFFVHYFGLIGEGVHNFDPSKNNNGYILGFRFGDKKVKDKNQWQVLYSYRRLGDDAWLDIFPDSTFYSGATDVKGHKFNFCYGLNKNIIFNFDYYHSENIHGVERPENIIRADTTFKF